MATVRLRARYERLVQEQLMTLTETGSMRPVSEDPGQWQLIGKSKSSTTEHQRLHLRDQARQLVQTNPHAKNILRLLESYVTGPGLQLSHQPLDSHQTNDSELGQKADQLWRLFLHENCRHYSFREHARRTWRDGECFVRKFSRPGRLPTLRFIDPEWIGPTADEPDSQGIITDPYDVERPVEFLKVSPGESRVQERISAQDLLQSRINVDSNEKRGISLFSPVVEAIASYDQWMETEMLARKLQASIVLWRKVQGSHQTAESLADQAAGGSRWGREGRRERYSPGTILTTNHGTEMQFLQPNTNFNDAVPLGRMLLLSVAAGAGLPEFMLTADASNANFASTMIAEGPAVKYFQSEQQFFTTEFTRLWHWVMTDAQQQRLLPDDFFDRMTLQWTYPQLVNRDRPSERLADVQLVESGILSRAEIGRREGVNPLVMRAEWQAEKQEIEQS